MAFDLKVNNLTGVSVITQPGGVKRTQETFITLYDYATQYKPELIPDLYYANGKGNITGMLSLLGREKTYASDMIQHAEMNRLHNKVFGATVSGNTVTCPSAHNAQPNMKVKISDGVKEVTAYVNTVTSTTVFTVLNTKVAPFNFAGPVDIVIDFTNSWDKGSGTFSYGNTWNPKYYKNYTNIVKWRYDVSNSDMAHDIWIDTPDGPRWCNLEIERSNTMFDNIVELTHFFGERDEDGSASALAGKPQGSKGIIQQIEERGNISNGYIENIADLEEMALRIVEQGVDVTEYTILCNLEQMNKFNSLMSLVSPAAVNAGSYGAFNNSKEMALKLDFTSVLVSSITFYFKHWKLLNDPTLMNTGKFDTTGVAFIGIPMGKTSIKDESGTTRTVPYLTIYNRAQGNVNRKREVKIFGPGGTPQVEDKMSVHYLNESTNQVVGANAFFVGRRGAYYQTV